MIPTSHVLPNLVVQRATEQPSRVFVEDVRGGTATYAELEASSRTWADVLASVGVAAGDTVATMMPTGIESVAIFVGVGRLGAIEVPIHLAYKGMMLEHVLADSAASVLVVHPDQLAEIVKVLERAPNIVTVVVLGEPAVPSGIPAGVAVIAASALAAAAESATLAEPTGRDIAAILYTSGTTGPSKGVMVTWAQIHATAEGAFPTDVLDENDVIYAPFPQFHMVGKWKLYLALILNARLVIREQFDTKCFWEEIDRFRCTTTTLLGAMANFLLRQPPTAQDAETPLKYVLMVPNLADADQFASRFGLHLRTVWGMTEVSVPIATDGFGYANPRTCGRVRPGYQVRIVDEHDEEVPDGEVGELVVRADEPWRMMAGYWGRPEATVECWRNLWLHSGDAFTRDSDGNYYFVDRKKDAIRRRGENISSQEVEAAVNSFPPVLESAVVAVASEWGEDEVLAAVVPKAGQQIVPHELVAFLTDRLPAFMLPRYIDVTETLPRTPTEKIKKIDVRARGLTATTWDRLGDATSEQPTDN